MSALPAQWQKPVHNQQISHPKYLTPPQTSVHLPAVGDILSSGNTFQCNNSSWSCGYRPRCHRYRKYPRIVNKSSNSNSDCIDRSAATGRSVRPNPEIYSPYTHIPPLISYFIINFKFLMECQRVHLWSKIREDFLPLLYMKWIILFEFCVGIPEECRSTLLGYRSAIFFRLTEISVLRHPTSDIQNALWKTSISDSRNCTIWIYLALFWSLNKFPSQKTATYIRPTVKPQGTPS